MMKWMKNHKVFPIFFVLLLSVMFLVQGPTMEARADCKAVYSVQEPSRSSDWSLAQKGKGTLYIVFRSCLYPHSEGSGTATHEHGRITFRPTNDKVSVLDTSLPNVAKSIAIEGSNPSGGPWKFTVTLTNPNPTIKYISPVYHYSYMRSSYDKYDANHNLVDDNIKTYYTFFSKYEDNIILPDGNRSRVVALTYTHDTTSSITKQPTCTATGIRTYKCTCGSVSKTETIPALGHSTPSSWSYDGTNHYKNCTRCGARLQTVAHTWSGWQHDASNHWKKCTVCSAIGQKAAHTKPSSWSQDASNHFKNCTVCGRRLETVAHSWSWKQDASNHWQACSGCGRTQNKAAHKDGNGDGLCDTCKRDIKIPTLSRATYKVESNGYYVYAYVTDNSSGVAKVAFPSWTELNGQDDIQSDWSNKALGTAGSWTVDGQTYNYRYFVDRAAHKNESGPYTTDIYVYDKTGNGGYAKSLTKIYLTTSIVFDPNGGSGGQGSATWVIGSTQYPTSPTRPGYAFDNWNKAANGSGAWWPKNNVVTVDMSKYYAQWNAGKYQVVFHPNGGTIGTVNRQVTNLLDGPTINSTFKNLAGSLDRIKYIKSVSAMPKSATAIISKAGEKYPVYAAAAGDTIQIYTEADRVQMHASSGSMLANMPNLQDIGPIKFWATDNTTDLSSFFSGDKALKSLDLSAWKTESVEKLNNLFYNCSALQEIQVSDTWTTKMVGEYTNGANVFYGCSSLKNYNASKVDVSYANADTGYLTEGENLFDTYARQAITRDKKALLNANPYTKTGYQFGGWAAAPDGEVAYRDKQEVLNLAADTDDIIVLYAIWENNGYQIQFEKNDEKAEGTMENQTFSYDITEKLNPNEYLKTGYHFIEWNTKPDFTGTGYADEQAILNLTTKHNDLIPFYAKWKANPYTVRFNKNAEKAEGRMADQAFTYDVAQDLTKNSFTRPGYTFRQWNRAADLSGDTYADQENVINLTTVKDDIVDLYVDWKPNNFTVVFDGNTGEGTMEDMHFTYDVSQNLIPNKFHKTGYTFSGWNTAPDGSGLSYEDQSSVKNLTTEVDGVVTLYAQWTAHGYIIQYTGNGADSGTMKNQIAKYDTPTNLLKNEFERVGYAFDGWSAIIDGVTRKFEDEDVVLNLTTVDGSVVTMRAQWKVGSYFVVFDKNSPTATGTMRSQAMQYDDLVKLSKNAFQNVGYVFDSWNTKPDGSGTKYEDQAEVQNLVMESGKSLTLYAQWKPVTYQIVFDANGGTGEMSAITVPYGNKTKLPKVTFEKTGYPFTVWNTNQDGTGISYADQAEIMNLTSEAGKVITLYAQWDAATYFVNFHKNDALATGEMAQQPMVYDAAQQLKKNQFVKPGYSFAKWTEKADGSGKSYMDQATVMNIAEEADSEVDLYAQWTPNMYYIRFDKNDPDAKGTMTDQQLTFDVSQFLKANTFEKDGYTFANWNTKPDGSGDSYTNRQAVKNLLEEKEGILTLYAQWDENHYTVDFNKNADDATGSMLAQPFDYGEQKPLTANSFKRVGYTFGGWTTNPDGTGTSYQDKQPVSNLTKEPRGIVTLYAKWIPHTYTVQFDANLTDVTGATVSQNFTYGVAQKLNKSGYTSENHLFNGWNTKPDGSGKAYFDGEEVKNLTPNDKGIVVLYGQWLADAYYVEFNGNGADSGEMGKQGLIFNQETPLNANRFKKEGHHFVHWTTNPDGTGSVYKDKEAVVNIADNGTRVLYAQWAPNEYRIIYDKNAETATGEMKEDTLTYGVAGMLSKNAFVRPGYTFGGWNTAKDGSGTDYKDGAKIQDLSAEQNGTVTLYAQWKANVYYIDYSKNNPSAAGSTLSVKATYGEDVLISKCGFTLNGYTCTEWNTAEDGSGTSYPVGAEVKNLVTENNGRITLYAQWKPNSYLIRFNKNTEKATGEMKSQSVAFDSTVKLTANGFAYTGYQFMGWNTEAKGTGTSYANQAEIKNLCTAEGETITLYAQWKPISYTIRFHKNDNAASGEMAEQTILYDQSTALNENQFVKDGHSFTKWSVTADGFGNTYENKAIVKNLTATDGAVIDLYAQWSTVKYFVSFDKNAADATGTMSKATFGYDQKQRLPINGYVRTGYKFVGWNVESDGTGGGYADQALVLNLTNEANGEVTLFAQWEANTYQILFDKNHKDATGTMNPLSADYDKEATLTTNQFSRTGYVFDSWNLKPDGSGVKFKDGEALQNLAVSEGSQVTLYAQWKPITYTIHFDSGTFNATGTTPDQKVTYDEKTKLNANGFTREGYLFEGWSFKEDGSGSKLDDKAEVVNLCKDQGAEITLYATWGHSNYYVEFHGNGADSGSMERQTMVYGEAATLNQNLFGRDGFTFGGWNTEEDGTGTPYEDGEEVQNLADTAEAVIDLYAQWDTGTSKIRYELNGGSWKNGFTPTEDKIFTESMDLPTSANISKEGFIFLGWYTNASCVGTAVTELPADSGSVTLYARWYDMTIRDSGISEPIIHDFTTQ